MSLSFVCVVDLMARTFVCARARQKYSLVNLLPTRRRSIAGHFSRVMASARVHPNGEYEIRTTDDRKKGI